MLERLCLFVLAALLVAAPAGAKDAVPVATNPVIEARMMALAEEQIGRASCRERV